MDQKALQDALALAQSALNDDYDIEDEENEEYSDIEDDVLDQMLKEEETSGLRKQNRSSNVHQKKSELISKVDNSTTKDLNHDDMLIEEDEDEEFSENDKNETIDEINFEERGKIQKPVSLPETSHRVSQPKQQTPVRKQQPIVKPSTKKVSSLEINDFEDIKSTSVKSPNEIRNDGFEMLKEILKSQIEDNLSMLNELMYYDRNQAMQLKRTIKIYEEDLRIVKLAHSSPNVPLPLYTIEDRKMKCEIANFDISEHEIQIVVEKMTDVKPSTSKDPYPGYYILCSFQQPDSIQKFKTATNNTYVFNHVHHFIIDRQKKLDKRKIVFEVYKPGQWFTESTLFGKCELPLTILLESCTHQTVVNLIKDKKKVASLFVKLKIKYPLKERKFELKTMRQVVIKKHFGSYEEYENYNSERNAKQANKEVKEEKNKSQTPINEVEEVDQIINKPDEEIKSATDPIKQTEHSIKENQGTQSSTKKEVKEAKSSFYLVPLDHLFSIGVLEYEKSRTMQFLQVAKRNKNDDDIFELEQRLSEINSKIMILNYQAQSGQLTQEDYVEIVKKRIEEELLIAKKLKSTHKEAALEAMRRKKIMEKELAGG